MQLNTVTHPHTLSWSRPAPVPPPALSQSPDVVQVDFSRARSLGTCLELAGHWSDVAGAAQQPPNRELPDHWRSAASRLETRRRWSTPEQTFTGRTSAGADVDVHLQSNLESQRSRRHDERAAKWTVEQGSPEAGLDRWRDRMDQAAAERVGANLVRLDEPGTGWDAYPASDLLNCRGDALRRWTHGDHHVTEGDAGLLLNALGATNVPMDRAGLGDLVGYGVHGQPGDPDYRVSHLGTVVGFDSDGHPLVGGRDGDYGVWMGRMEDWRQVYGGDMQVYDVPAGASLK